MFSKGGCRVYFQAVQEGRFRSVSQLGSFPPLLLSLGRHNREQSYVSVGTNKRSART